MLFQVVGEFLNITKSRFSESLETVQYVMNNTCHKERWHCWKDVILLRLFSAVSNNPIFHTNLVCVCAIYCIICIKRFVKIWLGLFLRILYKVYSSIFVGKRFCFVFHFWRGGPASLFLQIIKYRQNQGFQKHLILPKSLRYICHNFSVTVDPSYSFPCMLKMLYLYIADWLKISPNEFLWSSTWKEC